ncbi:inovirus Gp2 family protein [Enterobacter sp. PTB]|uniref:inovirus Gp2 family protein n=1 Tax=Enterobacter TaxID=547 RepID=UPI003DA8F434
MSINIESYYFLNKEHVKRLRATLDKALSEYPRLLVVRVDLKLPDDDYDSTVITRFIVSLKAQISADLRRKQKEGKRLHHCRVRFAWVREFGCTGKKHYHLVLLFNKDTYGYPGSYYRKNDKYKHNLAFMIMEAWGRTLDPYGFNNTEEYYSLVSFPSTNCYYQLNTRKSSFDSDYQTAINHINYLAKVHSKDYSDGQRNFGCSQY